MCYALLVESFQSEYQLRDVEVVVVRSNAQLFLSQSLRVCGRVSHSPLAGPGRIRPSRSTNTRKQSPLISESLPRTRMLSGRLASFKGPSTPAPSPSKAKQLKSPGVPQSPARSAESTYHRKLRASLQELQQVAENWDDIVLIEGLKAAKSLVDARTELESVSKFVH